MVNACDWKHLDAGGETLPDETRRDQLGVRLVADQDAVTWFCGLLFG